MALSKRYLFTKDLQDVSQLGFVLSHPARLQILWLFSQYPVWELNEIQEYIPLSAATISDHLRYLERAGLLVIGASQAGRSGYLLDRQRYEGYLSHLHRWLADQGMEDRKTA